MAATQPSAAQRSARLQSAVLTIPASRSTHTGDSCAAWLSSQSVHSAMCPCTCCPCRCNLGSSRLNFHTIMAYSCTGGSLRAAYLSTPSITVSGVPAGSATQAHSARRITETAASRAAVFNEKVNGPFAALASQVNSNKCLDAWKYVQGTQVRPAVLLSIQCSKAVCACVC